MLIEFLKDTEVEGILYHTGDTTRLNSEVCRQLIESGNAKKIDDIQEKSTSKHKVYKTK